MIYSTTIAPFQHHRLLPIPLSLLPIFFATFIFKLYVIFASFIITTKKPYIYIYMDDLRSSVLAEVVGMSYHQSWPRHQTRKRHHSLQVCQPILPFISNNINKDREQERIEWTSSIFGVQNQLLKPHEVH